MGESLPAWLINYLSLDYPIMYGFFLFGDHFPKHGAAETGQSLGAELVYGVRVSSCLVLSCLVLLLAYCANKNSIAISKASFALHTNPLIRCLSVDWLMSFFPIQSQTNPLICCQSFDWFMSFFPIQSHTNPLICCLSADRLMICHFLPNMITSEQVFI